MADIAIVWNPQLGYGDLAMAGADLLANDDLVTAALISAFTEQGWWGDDPGDPIGSKISTLISGPADGAPNRAKAYLLSCWAWMTRDGVCADVQADAQWISAGVLGCRGVFTRPDGTKASVQFDWAWAELS